MKSRISDKTRLKRGLGKGDENHKPFIRPRDFSSKGRVHRMKLSKAKNIQVALSDLERKYMLMCEFASNVVGVKTQVALLPLKATQKIAWNINIKHPGDGVEDRIMTTDLLLDIEEDTKIKQLAISIKPATLLTERVIELFSIEQAYWEAKKVDWIIMTERELDVIKTNNLLFLRDYRNAKNQYHHSIFKWLTENQSTKTNQKIGQLIKDAALHFRITSADAKNAFLHLMSTRSILFDIGSSFNWEREASEFNLVKV